VLLLTYEQHKKTSNTQSATVIDKFELASAASAATSRVLCRCASSGAQLIDNMRSCPLAPRAQSAY